jgi:hypothetical protein
VSLEDVEQARRILAGLTLHSNLGIDLDHLRERVHIVEAARLHNRHLQQVLAQPSTRSDSPPQPEARGEITASYW